MESLFNSISEAYILITLIFLFSMFSVAKFNGYTRRESVIEYENMIIPGIIIFVIFVLSNTLSVYKLILFAELIFYIIITIERLTKKIWHIAMNIILSLVISLVLVYGNYLPLLVNINIRWFAIVQIVSISLYFILKPKASENKTAKIHFTNALSSLTFLFIYSQDGAFVVLLIKVFYFIILFKELSNICKNEKLKVKKKYESIKDDFDEEVRRQVKSQLFYMELSKEKMSEIAKLDDMTKVYNKKTILNKIKENIENKDVKTFSLLIFDIDNFKSVNDELGHIQGDKCIINLANKAKESLRDNDMVGRYGGDEFFAVINDADLHTAVQIAERLRQNVDKSEDPHYTISIGIANYPNDAEDDKALIKYADDGLYIAKNKGRNRLGYLKKQAIQKK